MSWKNHLENASNRKCCGEDRWISESTFTHADYSSSKQDTSGALNFHRGPLHLKEALLLASRRFQIGLHQIQSYIALGFPKGPRICITSLYRLPRYPCALPAPSGGPWTISIKEKTGRNLLHVPELRLRWIEIPSGKLTFCNGKSLSLLGKFTISMDINGHFQ